MIAGISGSLLSHEAMERVIPIALRGQLGEGDRSRAHRQLQVLHRRIEAAGLGPASSARAVFDAVGAPLLAHLGYRALPLSSSGASHIFALQAGGRTMAVMVVTPWGHDLSATWREAVRQGIGSGARWCFCLSGTRLRIADSERTYSRRYLELDISVLDADETAFGIAWGLLRAPALSADRPNERGLLDRAVSISDGHRVFVRDTLQRGVEQALTCLLLAFNAANRSHRLRLRDREQEVKQECLIVLYRLLFLLFAEARGLVPHWHPVFRDAYTLESLRKDVETLARPTGLWEALQAIFRLAHHGCRAGALRVPPFNGRLFSPAHAPLADALPLADGPVREALLALTTRAGKVGRERIAYGDLGVEQLGGVYERLLDFDGLDRHGQKVPGDRRKATGSFYPPRPLTEYLVRRALAPLVEGATPDRILALRVLDPAMGSGAFLVAACRYLGAAYEQALIREGSLTAHDIAEADRAGFRRLVAQQCLFGVDANPMAVQLGRLSLWLATLAADRPLTFLDHRLRAGDSLVGSSPSDVLRQPPPGRTPGKRPVPLPLFEHDGLGGALGSAIAVRTAVACEPGDTLAQVRGKERALAALEADDSPLRRWKRVADIWCSGWFRSDASRAELRSAFHSLVEMELTGRSSLPQKTVDRMLAQAEAVASARHFFHWPLEFPEAFHDERGSALDQPGFDAVIGNPPWEMLRADRAGHDPSDDRVASQVAGFARTAGVYRLQGDGHANLYQLFVERSLSLVRKEGRIALILPSGFAVDHGCAALRRTLLDATLVDTFQCVENREGLFPIHRGLKFLLVSATAGRSTGTLPARFGLRKAETLDSLPDIGEDTLAVPLTRPFLDRFSGPQLVIPEIRSATDLQIVSSITFSIPALAAPDGWRVTFGRELNATDDRRHFVQQGPGIPVIDGKHIRPFAVDPARARNRVPHRVADRLAGGRLAHRRPRLAYRDVASSTNRLTLISAIVPAGVLTTHTVFCAREEAAEDVQWYLCGMLNSFVANYLVRLQVGTHVTVSMMARLPVPRPARDSAAFQAIVSAATRLGSSPDDLGAGATLQAAAARLYGLGRNEFAHVLKSFPLVSTAERDAALGAFTV
jgi:hypothetical protein